MLTRENYFSPENEMKYFGSTQFKSFQECESMAMAKIRGEYVPEPSTALLVGQYVDSHFEGTTDLFQAQHPEMFRQDGGLKSEFLIAEGAIARMESDEMFMKYAAGGEEQVIMTAKLFDHDFKIRIDNYHPGKAIVDRKFMSDFEPVRKKGMGRVNFAIAWGYDIQGAIYQAVEHQWQMDHGNRTADPLPFIIAGATKQKDGPDLGLFRLPQVWLVSALKIVEHYIDHYADIKTGLVEAVRCEKCAWCRQTKVLRTVKTLEDIYE